MIDLYTWDTSNGRKASVMLEETGLEYRVFPIDLSKGEQANPDYRLISPNGKIPAIVDHAPGAEFGNQPLTVFESGAILLYLAQKSGRLLPHEPTAKMLCMQWLMFGLAEVGPILAQLHHFRRHAKEQVPYGINRYSQEAARLYQVLDTRLQSTEYLGGSEYTVADIASYTWVARHEWQEVNLDAYPNVKRWYELLGQRPAIQRGFAIPQRAV